jgi:hypothetical protein
MLDPSPPARRPAVVSGILIIWASFALIGCAARLPVSAGWRLVDTGDHRVLVPPGAASADIGKRKLVLDTPPAGGKCPPGIRVRGRSITLTVNRDELLDHPQGWLTEWTDQLESSACIAPGQGTILATRIAEALPFDPNRIFQLLHPNDIEPPERLQVVSPILRDGSPPDAPLVATGDVAGAGNDLTLTLKASNDLIGYETAVYEVRRKSSGPGFLIAPLYADRHIGDNVERTALPSTNYLAFPADASFYRLFLKSDQTDFTALLIGATARELLPADVASCNANDRRCVPIARRVAINQMIPVTVNGAEMMVRWGANVAEAIRTAGERRPQNTLASLTISKTYQQRAANVDFDRRSPAILDLPLNGGEIITWTHQ